jgi:hypothetical protein
MFLMLEIEIMFTVFDTLKNHIKPHSKLYLNTDLVRSVLDFLPWKNRFIVST